MALRLGEYAVEQVKAKLQANMPTRVAAINIDPALPLLDPPLAVPASYYTSGLESIPDSPAIIVAEGPAGFSEEGPHTLLLDIEVGVWVLEADPDRQLLGKRLQRQTRAVIESLYDAAPLEQLTPIAFRIFPTRTQPGRVFEPDQVDAWRGFYLTIFNVQQIEE
jgi:hypothetical protein